MEQVRLAELTTFHVGGPAGAFRRHEVEDDLVAAVRAADEAGEPILVLGGGSNLLVCDDGFPGAVHQVATSGIAVEAHEGGAVVTVAAGVPWDALVVWSLAQGLVGLEALSGIPGLVGAGPVQNVGAYGAEVASCITGMRALDRRSGRVVTVSPEEAGFGYRTSMFKREAGSWVVLEVSFALASGPLSTPVRYAELARRLGVAVGDRAPALRVREAVLGLRRGKGMVVDPADHDTWSAGSFFTNPLVSADRAAALPAGVPAFPGPDGMVKVSAAWLIDRAGFAKGFALAPDARAALSGKHTLALTNRGGASAADILELARTIRDGVQETFGITLVIEPVLVGLAL